MIEAPSMRRLWLAGMVLITLAGGARAEEEYVTVRDRIMCRTQQSLRESMKAIETKDRNLMRKVQGCNYSLDGVAAILIQDHVSMINIRVAHDESDAAFWALLQTM